MPSNTPKPQFVVITHPEWGIYVGNAIGLGFWSKTDAAEQNMVPVFPGEAAARAHIESWENNNDPAVYGFVAVIPSQRNYASTQDLIDAGLEDEIGGLRCEELDPEDLTPTMH